MEEKNVIQEDWHQREFVATVHFGMSKIVSFLNRFEAEARFKLAMVNEQLTRLERSCDFVEAILKHSNPADPPRKAKAASITGTVFDSEWRLKELKRKSTRQGPGKPILKTITSSVKGRIFKSAGPSEMKQHFQPPARAVPEMKQPISETKMEEKVGRPEEKKSPVEDKPDVKDQPGKPPVVKPPTTPPGQPPLQPVGATNTPSGPPTRPPPGPGSAQPGTVSGPPQTGPPLAPSGGPPGVPQAALPPPIPQTSMSGPPGVPPPGPGMSGPGAPPPGPGAPPPGPGAPPPGPGAPPPGPGVSGPGVPPSFSGPPKRPPPQPAPGIPTEVKESKYSDEEDEESSYDDPPIMEFKVPIPADHDDIWIERKKSGNTDKPGPLPNSSLVIEYTGWIKNTGDCFDQIDDYPFQMGSGDNIVGLEKILLKMKEGETILAFIPSHLAYGEQGGGDVIPPNSDLVFDLTLISIQ